MNKILVVGHPLSGYESVTSLLNANGMSLARPSKKEGMKPTEISDHLLKAHQHDLERMASSDQFKQLAVSPVWNGLALDLMLGNIDQEFWGWSDTNAISMLEYWRSLDSQLAFVLVYDSPHDLIMQAFDDNEAIEPKDLQAVIDSWLLYNEAMLSFYHRNSECSILVNSQQIRANSTEYLQQVRKHIGVPLSIGTVATDVEATEVTKTEKDKVVTLDEELNSKQMESAYSVSMPSRSVRSYMTWELLKQYPNASQFYEELQAVADLPLTEDPPQRVSASEAMSALSRVIKDHQESVQKENKKNQELQEAKKTWDKKLQESSRKSDELVDENELILQQMLHLQEEIERYHLENLDLKHKVSQIPVPEPKPSGAADRIKKQLEYRLGAIMIEHSRSLSGWMSMLSSLRRETEQFRLELDTKDGKKLPPISQYADVHEAERVKRHLSYRLGVAMMESKQSTFGWIRLPLALRRAVYEFRQDRNKVKT